MPKILGLTKEQLKERKKQQHKDYIEKNKTSYNEYMRLYMAKRRAKFIESKYQSYDLYWDLGSEIIEGEEIK